MIRYGLNVLGLSVIISVITAALVYFALNGLLVQPMMRIARNMLHFSQQPGGCQPHHRALAAARRDRHRRARARPHAGRADADPASEEPPRRARPGGEQDQSRPAQHAGQRPADLGPAGQPARSGRAALRAQAHRLARPRHQPLRQHAEVRPRRGGAAAARADAVCARWSRRSATAWACRARTPSTGRSRSTTRCASMPTATSCSAS